MAVLELSAIDLDYRARILQQRLCSRLHHTSFPAAGGTQKQKRSDRAPRGRQPRNIRLVGSDDLVDGVVLSDHQLAQPAFEIFRLASLPVRVEQRNSGHDVTPYRIAQACASGSAASALRHAFLRNGIHTDVGNSDSNRQAAQGPIEDDLDAENQAWWLLESQRAPHECHQIVSGNSTRD